MHTELAERLRRQLANRSGQPVVTVLTRRGPPSVLTGGDILTGAEALARTFRRLFGDGPHAFILALPPGEQLILTLLACLLNGHTAVPIAVPRAGTVSSRLAHAADDCRATAVVCAASGRRAIEHQIEGQGLTGIVPIIALDDGADPESRLAGRPETRAHHDGSTEPAAVIQYTSGSTRRAHGVRIGGPQIVANCELVARSWDLDESSRVVNWMPHYHDMGLMGGIIFPMLVGAQSFQMHYLEMIRHPASWLRAISDHRATFSGGPAFAFAECLRRATPDDCAGLDLSTWSRAYCGAELVPAGLLPAFRSRFSQYGLEKTAAFACYGLAEMTLFAAGAPEADDVTPVPPPGCAAVHPVRLTEATAPNLVIVDPGSNRVCSDGRPGEIWLRGPSKGDGYLNSPSESRATFAAAYEGSSQADWLRTGDLGVVSDGFLYVTGRLKDIVIANGRKIAAPELEWLAASIDEALNPLAAAAFMPDETETAVAVLFVELKPGRPYPERPSAVRDGIRRALAGEYGVRLSDLRILPRGTLERTSSGKVRRASIADAYRKGELPLAYRDITSGLVGEHEV